MYRISKMNTNIMVDVRASFDCFSMHVCFSCFLSVWADLRYQMFDSLYNILKFIGDEAFTDGCLIPLSGGFLFQVRAQEH